MLGLHFEEHHPDLSLKQKIIAVDTNHFFRSTLSCVIFFPTICFWLTEVGCFSVRQRGTEWHPYFFVDAPYWCHCTLANSRFTGGCCLVKYRISSTYVRSGLNCHYFNIIGDGRVINPIVGVYIPIKRIPIKGGMTIPNIATFDHGTYVS